MAWSQFPQIKASLYKQRDDAHAFIRLRAYADAQTIADKMRLRAFGGTTFIERQTLEEMAERLAKGIETAIADEQRTPQAQQVRRILEDLRPET